MNRNIRSSKKLLHYYDFYHPFLNLSNAHVYLMAITANSWYCRSLVI